MPLRICILALAIGTVRADDSGTRTVELSRWLSLDPVTSAPPAFAQDEVELLGLSSLAFESLVPELGAAVRRHEGSVSRWRETDKVELDGKDKTAQVTYVATYISVDRFTTASLKLHSQHAFEAWLDDASVAKKTEPDAKGAKEISTTESEIHLRTGDHLLLIKSVRDPDGPDAWSLTAQLVLSGEYQKSEVGVTIDPRHRLTIADLLDRQITSGASLSADGSLIAIRIREPNLGPGPRRDALEIVRSSDGARIHTVRGPSLFPGLDWAPTGRRFAYATRDGDNSTIWITNLDDGTTRSIANPIEKLASFSWTPDGRRLIYGVTTEGKKDERGVQRLRGLTDRWTNWRQRTHLWELDVEDGSRRQLTTGEWTTSLQDVRPDSRALLFTRRIYHYDRRPYSTTTLYELDLQSLDARELGAGIWLADASYSPRGDRILLRGGPSAFGDVGVNVAEGQTPNEYDGQAYFLDPQTRKVETITRSFDPAIQGARWSHDGSVFFMAAEGSHTRLYRYEPLEKSFTSLPTQVEVTSGFALARSAAKLVYYGSSADSPSRVYAVDLEKAEAQERQVAFPSSERFSRIRLGRVEPWSFETESGDTIIGRVHYPPDFNADKRYPLIVYYYGGTSPSSRSFGGRYPKNLWAAHGYVVYVLQPSGAFGFGQEFSARHVNNWGKTVADEILQGVRGFLAAHSFVDPKRIGCIGASYGGFMTMNLLTKSDRFAAAVSHAGISSLSSYWGEGWWGYLYSAVATAESFPWNRKDLYVGESALFNADKIKTPLLLLHGTADTNVPVGESEQMYTALKILGKEVEYVRFKGENHWILEPKKRVVWMETIIAWFDKKLKGRGEYWDHLYPPAGVPKPTQ